MKKMKRPLAAAVGFGLLLPLAACFPGEPDAAVTQSATTWLVGQQQTDGGFDVAGFPGFETPDAILALAETAQTGPYFDTDAARKRIDSVVKDGKTPLDNVDDLIDGATVPSVAASAQAAKVAALVAEPLGIDPTDFDPSNDTPTVVDLIARINQVKAQDGTFAFGAQFNGVLYAAIALQENGEDVPAGLINQIIGAQRPDGSWNYAGNKDSDPAGDVDTTSLALLALALNYKTVADNPVRAGVAYLAGAQEESGAWSNFGENPNSTAVAAVALSALHVDVTTSAWRATYGHPIAKDSTYVSPYDYLKARKAGDGHIAGPNDQYGPNTFGTSQAIQALSRQWFLDDEHQNVSYSLAYFLMTNGDNDPSDADATIVSDTLGPNASIGAARVRAAAAAVNSQAGREETVDELFQQALGRPVDSSGRSTFSAQLVNNDRPSVLQALVTSQEFNKANPLNGDYVDALYDVVLNRTADVQGRADWVNALNKGTSRASVAKSFISSNEYRVNTVNDVYDRLVARAPNNFELFTGVVSLANVRIETTIAQVGGSQEYYDLVSSDSPNASAKASTFSRN